MPFRTQQEEFWAGEFGDSYIQRNVGAELLASNLSLFSAILRNAAPIASVLEFGPNVGMNLQALHSLLPLASLAGVEINANAVELLARLGYVEVIHRSILEFSDNRSFDLVFTKGVLIHINPDYLPTCYEKLHSASAHYICIAEYYSPKPAEITYRGHQGRLFKRDFAGEMLDLYKDLELVDYGFAYHRARFPQDDINWFLLRKIS